MPSIEPTPNGDWSPALPGLGRLSLRWVLLARPRRLRVLASISAFLMLFIIVDTAAFSAPAHGILLDHWDQRPRRTDARQSDQGMAVDGEGDRRHRHDGRGPQIAGSEGERAGLS